MSTLNAIRCTGCGGTVRAVPGKPLPHCLFCGSDASDLVPFDPPEAIEPPSGAIPFVVSDADARAAFVKFAGSSFWYPSDLRKARLELKHLLLPAWAWSGDVETHYTGLVSANTKSGKRPVSGQAALHFDQILVPASKSLRQSELLALGFYDEGALAPFDPDYITVPIELSELTRSSAKAQAQDVMEGRHRSLLQSEKGLTKILCSSLVTDLVGKPVLVPVFIGAYRYGDRTFRILVNGQTGRFVGAAPKSVWKIAAVVMAIIGAILALVVCLGGSTTLLALIGAVAS